MLITEEFVVINNPKTGSRFVRTVLKKIYKGRERRKNLIKRVGYKMKIIQPDITELILPNIKMRNWPPDPHGAYSQIPPEHKNKPVVSVVRNPFSRFLSTYEFRWWATHLSVDKSVIEEKFPSFPNLTLDQYSELDALAIETRLKTLFGRDDIVNNLEIGNQTVQFIQMFFQNPKEVIANLSDDYISSKEYKKDMGNVNFLRQENLNDELVQFLSDYNYSEEELNLVQNFERVNVTKSQVANRQDLWTEKALNHVKHRERYLLQIFDDLNMHYHPPGIQTVNSLS